MELARCSRLLRWGTDREDGGEGQTGVAGRRRYGG